jgi:hypothetical protein
MFLLAVAHEGLGSCKALFDSGCNGLSAIFDHNRARDGSGFESRMRFSFREMSAEPSEGPRDSQELALAKGDLL